MNNVLSEFSLKKFQWLAWLVLFCMLIYYGVEQNDSLLDSVNYAVHCVTAYAIILYGNALWLYPRFYQKKKYLVYIVCATILLVSVSYLRTASWHAISAGITTKPYTVTFSTYIYTFIIHCLIFLFSIAFRYTIDFFRIKQQQEILLKQHAQAQLDLLKAQVQPHFLFNTLNNIYFIAQRESPQTAVLLEKLSAIMRYFIDQGSKDRISLASELNFIRNYIELEKLRIRYPIRTDIKVTGEVEQVKIPPMLLIPMVENVFKHGIDKSKQHNFIEIHANITGQLFFEVSNNSWKNVEEEKNGCGTGLKNLRERLEILYPDHFSFTTHREGERFTSTLIIPL
jgi:sensor histidine kinase YesM